VRRQDKSHAFLRLLAVIHFNAAGNERLWPAMMAAQQAMA
jgi:hypothetical protein